MKIPPGAGLEAGGGIGAEVAPSWQGVSIKEADFLQHLSAALRGEARQAFNDAVAQVRRDIPQPLPFAEPHGARVPWPASVRIPFSCFPSTKAYRFDRSGVRGR